MAETLAEKWRRTKPVHFEDFNAYIEALRSVDEGEIIFRKTDIGAVIVFSDGSTHLMGR